MVRRAARIAGNAFRQECWSWGDNDSPDRYDIERLIDRLLGTLEDEAWVQRTETGRIMVEEERTDGAGPCLGYNIYLSLGFIDSFAEGEDDA
jgi:hypothetical protein